MRRARVLLADDHAIVAEGLAALLRGHFDLVGTVGDGNQLIDAARELQPDVIVADMAMPVLSGLEVLRRLKAERIDAKVIFLTMHADVHLATEALRAGASGYVLKHAAGEELITAIQEVLQERTYLTPLIAKDVITGLMAPEQQADVTLTPRQREVLQLHPDYPAHWDAWDVDRHYRVAVEDVFVSAILSVACTVLAEIGEDYKRPHADVRDLYTWAERFRAGAIPVIERGETYEAEVPLRRRDGTPILCHVSGRAIDPGDIAQGSIWIMQDVTVQHAAQEAALQRIVHTDRAGELRGGEQQRRLLSGRDRAHARGRSPQKRHRSRGRHLVQAA